MQTIFIIIIGFLFIACVVMMCTMLIYTHKRMDDIVGLFNDISNTCEAKFNNRDKEIKDLTDHVNDNFKKTFEKINNK